jgi:hypothetical protein
MDEFPVLVLIIWAICYFHKKGSEARMDWLFSTNY